jgi:hypothetical protein
LATVAVPLKAIWPKAISALISPVAASGASASSVTFLNAAADSCSIQNFQRVM